MTEKEKLLIYGLVIEEGSYGEAEAFFMKHQKKLMPLGIDEVVSLLLDLQFGDFYDYQGKVTEKLIITHQNLKNEIEEKEAVELKQKEHFDNQFTTSKRQRKWFYPLLITALLGSLYSVVDFIRNITTEEVKTDSFITNDQLKKYVDSIQIETLDIVYGDTDIVNQK